jgi:REP element-mobilizing transposase RayT
MVVEEPFALFITWTCYGTWLPGDSRGHVSNILRFGEAAIPKRNMPEAEHSPGDEFTNNAARDAQKFSTVYLSNTQAITVGQSLIETAKIRDWQILRGAIMANHIHVVITECPDDGPGVRRILKGNSQKQLSLGQGESRRWWTKGGSNHYIHEEEGIRAAIRYVAEQKRKLVEIVDMEIMP